MGSVYRIDGPGFGSWKNPEALAQRVRHTGCFRGCSLGGGRDPGAGKETDPWKKECLMFTRKLMIS